MWCWKCTATNIQLSKYMTKEICLHCMFPLFQQDQEPSCGRHGVGAVWDGCWWKRRRRCSAAVHDRTESAGEQQTEGDSPRLHTTRRQEVSRTRTQITDIPLRCLVWIKFCASLQWTRSSRLSLISSFCSISFLFCFTQRQNCTVSNLLNEGIKKWWEKSQLKLNVSINNDVGLINQMEC